MPPSSAGVNSARQVGSPRTPLPTNKRRSRRPFERHRSHSESISISLNKQQQNLTSLPVFLYPKKQQFPISVKLP